MLSTDVHPYHSYISRVFDTGGPCVSFCGVQRACRPFCTWLTTAATLSCSVEKEKHVT
jgi:hypothetical protein